MGVVQMGVVRMGVDRAKVPVIEGDDSKQQFEYDEQR